MTKKILITSALPYANGPLHFGHIAGAYLPGDCHARFQRLLKNDVLYICGSDEYGVAITLSAEIARRTPKEHVDFYHRVNHDLFKKLHFSFDHYSRTTWRGHAELAQTFFLDLIQNGYIEERVTEQLYSETDHRFLADRYVVGVCPGCGYENARGDECPECGASYEATELTHPRSKLSGAPLTYKATKHWFLLLDRFKDRLNEWLETKDWKPNVVNFVRRYINDLRARAITRDSEWGVPVPLPSSEGKVLYVWFDAPIGYISAAKEWALKSGKPNRWKDYWCDPNTTLIHFIGKDNIPFHGVIFPAMTMGQNQPFKLVDQLPANEFYRLEGRQFSKSEGWYIDLETFFKTYTSDQIRYAIAANAPETSDSEFTWKDFQNRCNADLLGKYGNLVNRVLVFAHKQCQGIIPSVGTLEEVDRIFLKEIESLAGEAKNCFSTFSLRRSCQVMMELAQKGNVYFDQKQPWKTAKEEHLRASMETTIACCLECLKTLALISFPVIPETAEKVWQMLGFDQQMQDLGWEAIVRTPLKKGTTLSQATILFKKIEDDQIEAELKQLKRLSQPKHYCPLKESVDIDAFQKLDLRVAKVLFAKPVKKSSKLLELEVDLGFEVRTLVSGVQQMYSPEEIIGKKVIVIANLKPAKIMGIESQGMLLAGSWEKALELVGVDDLPPGASVS